MSVSDREDSKGFIYSHLFTGLSEKDKFAQGQTECPSEGEKREDIGSVEDTMDMIVNIIEEKEPEQKGQRGEKLPGADPLIPLQSYRDMSTNTNPIQSSLSIYFFNFFDFAYAVCILI